MKLQTRIKQFATHPGDAQCIRRCLGETLGEKAVTHPSHDFLDVIRRDVNRHPSHQSSFLISFMNVRPMEPVDVRGQSIFEFKSYRVGQS